MTVMGALERAAAPDGTTSANAVGKASPTSGIARHGRRFTWTEIRTAGEAFRDARGRGESGAGLPAFVVVRNKVYDIGAASGFLQWHPGGEVALSQVGFDASGAFEAFHDPRAFVHLARFFVGDLDPSEITAPSGFVSDVQKLRATIRQRGWDRASPAYYAAKIVSNLAILACAVAILAKFGATLPGVVVASIPLALFWQQSGWLAHDFLHHQVFKTRFYNDLSGYVLGNMCQGFSVAWWKHKHCTHHSTTNIHTSDPDIDTMPYLAWSEHAIQGFADLSDDKLTDFLVKNQPIFYFPLLTFARLMWAFQSILWNSKPAGRRTFPTLDVVERVCLALHYTWVFGAAFTLTTPLLAVVWIALGQLFCGLFLASVFSLNHNGMPVYSTKDAEAMEFYEISIRTGRNVEPTHFNNWFTGGLNFQIEHHMFPSVPRHNLHKIAPIVQDICRKHNIPYHVTSFGAGMNEVLDRLSSVAKLAAKLRLQHAD